MKKLFIILLLVGLSTSAIAMDLSTKGSTQKKDRVTNKKESTKPIVEAKNSELADLEDIQNENARRRANNMHKGQNSQEIK